MQIPFLSFDAIAAQTKAESMAVFERFWESKYYVLGNMTTQFETEYAAFSGVAHCKGVSNGLDALRIALHTLDIGPGDEVIMPSNAYIAALLAVSQTGATPVLTEPDPLTCNIDPARIESVLTPNTRCIMPVHLYGQSCEMAAICDLAQRHGLSVVEDNAQAQGAAHRGIATGAWGDINATSFYPTKNLGALGEAGALTTQSAVLAEKAAVLRNYGSQKRYHHTVQGSNWRIDELQAGLLSVRLRYLSVWNAARRETAARYCQYLDNIPGLQLPVTAEGSTHVYHLFVVQTPERDALQAFLAQKGIGTLIHYPIPPHLQQAYAGKLPYTAGDFPIAERLARECLSLPLYVGILPEQIDYICSQIHDFFK
jgi:dTDP-4-amino-4,6-dideoxygalactose transaminase